MRKFKLILFTLICLLLSPLTSYSAHRTTEGKVKVSITNLTGRIQLTPIMVASHARMTPWFALGTAASSALSALAEGGDSGPLMMQMKESGVLGDSVMTEGLLGPGQTTSVVISYDGAHPYLSIGSMLLPTNDGFIGLHHWRIPVYLRGKSILLSAYDAGSEDNDELCLHIPGPTCEGSALSEGDGEGYVYIHPGIAGVGDLVGTYDWKNPVAKVRIKVMR